MRGTQAAVLRPNVGSHIKATGPSKRLKKGFLENRYRYILTVIDK